MKKWRFTETQIVKILKGVESGRQVKEVCRENGISDATYYNWKSMFGGMEASDEKKATQGTGGRESPAEEDVCRGAHQDGDPQAGPGGKVVKPTQRREMASTAVRRLH